MAYLLYMKHILRFFLIVSLTSCTSLQFKYNAFNYVSQRQTLNIKTPTQVKRINNTHQLFLNTNPSDFGLSNTGNWVHCRNHGFHDLNDWTDFSFSPYFCRPTQGFISASQWNWNWGGPNHWNNNLMWNNRFNQWGYTPHRWSLFGYDRWGYNNYAWNNPYLWYGSHFNNYYGWNTGYRYNSNRYNRTSIINGRRGRVINRRSTNSIRTTPIRTNNVRPNRTTPTRTNNIRPIRTTPNRDTRVRTTPNRDTRVRTTPTRTSGNTTVIRRGGKTKKN